MRGMISTLMLTQSRYGISPDDLDPMTKAYIWALKDYDFHDIYKATEVLIKKMADIPKPAHIIAKIEEMTEEKRVKSVALPPPLHGWIADIAKEIGDVPARAWFERCEFDGEKLQTPDKMTRDWIEEKYIRVLKKTLGKCEIV